MDKFTLSGGLASGYHSVGSKDLEPISSCRPIYLVDHLAVERTSEFNAVCVICAFGVLLFIVNNVFVGDAFEVGLDGQSTLHFLCHCS